MFSMSQVKKANQSLQDADGKYSFLYYPRDSLGSDGSFLEYKVRSIESVNAEDAVRKITGSALLDDRSRGAFERFEDAHLKWLPEYQRMLPNELAKFVLIDLYQQGWVDRHSYFRWVRQTNALPPFTFRGYDEKSILWSLAVNHRRSSPNLEAHRVSTSHFMREFLRRLSLFFGIETRSGANILKQLRDSGFVCRVHVRQHHGYLRSV